MKIKPTITFFVVYTAFMFFAGKLFISPELSIERNFVIALIAGIVFIAIMFLYMKFLGRRKSASGK